MVNPRNMRNMRGCPVLSERVDELEALIEAQMRENAELRQRIEQMEQRQGQEKGQNPQVAASEQDVSPIEPEIEIKPQPQPRVNQKPLYE